MPRSSPRPSRPLHPLVRAVRLALPAARAQTAGPFLSLLARRLRALSAIAKGRAGALAKGASDRALARRFLAPFEGTWHDGDENLVRGFLDGWTRTGEEPRVADAQRLCRAADALARLETRPETLWFFLWAMESVLAGLAPDTGPRARIRSVRKRTPGRS
jgi:hypothetical protein